MSPTEIQTTLDHLHTHHTGLLIGGLVSLAGGFIQFYEIIRLGFRHRTHAVPLVVNLFYLANDTSYVFLFSRWFHDVPDPMFRQAWFLWFPYIALELVVAYQIIVYSGFEVFGLRSKRAAFVAYVAAQAAMFGFFYWLNEILDDYFLFITSMMTVIGSNMGIVLLAGRRSRKGQSLLLAGVLVFNQGFISFFVLFPSETPQFQTPAYYTLAAIVTALGWLYLYLLWRTPKYDPAAPASPAHP